MIQRKHSFPVRRHLTSPVPTEPVRGAGAIKSIEGTNLTIDTTRAKLGIGLTLGGIAVLGVGAFFSPVVAVSGAAAAVVGGVLMVKSIDTKEV